LENLVGGHQGTPCGGNEREHPMGVMVRNTLWGTDREHPMGAGKEHPMGGIYGGGGGGGVMITDMTLGLHTYSP